VPLFCSLQSYYNLSDSKNKLEIFSKWPARIWFTGYNHIVLQHTGCNETLNYHWFLVLFILPIYRVRGCGICSLVNRKILLELRSKLRSDALPVTTIDFFWDLSPWVTECKSSIRQHGISWDSRHCNSAPVASLGAPRQTTAELSSWAARSATVPLTSVQISHFSNGFSVYNVYKPLRQ